MQGEEIAGEVVTGPSVTRRLRQVIAKALRLEIGPDQIDGADLIREFGITSIDALEILINVEIEFGIEVADEDLNHALVASLHGLEEYVGKRLQDAPGE